MTHTIFGFDSGGGKVNIAMAQFFISKWVSQEDLIGVPLSL